MDSNLETQLRSLQTKFENQNRNSQAYLTILEAIKQLVLTPGKSYLERELAAALKISRTPVREAFSRLEMEEWGKIIPRKGFQVAPVRSETIEAISQIMTDIDGLTAQLAVENITDAVIEQLEEPVKQEKIAVQQHKLIDYIKIDDEFHNLIKQCCSNQRLISLITVYSDQMYRARLFTINERHQPIHSIREHEAIIAAFKDGDARAVRQQVEFQREQGSKEIIQILKAK